MSLVRPTFLASLSLCCIAIIGFTRIYEALPPQAVGVTVLCGTISILILYRFLKPFRDSIDATTTEQMICVHAIRAPVGAAFLVMSQEGLFPSTFASRAGYGDLFTAIMGLIVVVVGLKLSNTTIKRISYLIWNLFGLADLLVALGTGIYLALDQPSSMIWISRLPLLVVPTFILPILFSTHFLMIVRLSKNDQSNQKKKANQ